MARFGITALLCSYLLSACATTSPVANFENLARWRMLADQAYANKEFDRAIQLYGRLTEAVPKESENWFRLGNCHSRLGNHQMAIVAYREVLVRDPKHSKAWYNAGLMELKQAAQHFAEAESRLPKDDPVAQTSRKVNEGLLQLVEQSNQYIHQLKHKDGPVDTSNVEVIVIDEDKQENNP